MLATALVEHGFSAIFDVGLMVTEDQIRFTSDFASELLRINRIALHLYIDEADTFAPQLTENRGQKVCLGTVSCLVKQGGVRGVGVTMITQRPADINKKVLSQVDILTVLRMSHPLDIKAATDWIKSEVSVEFAGEVESALPSLPVGSAFFCSASLGIGERVDVRTRETFSSGRRRNRARDNSCRRYWRPSTSSSSAARLRTRRDMRRRTRRSSCANESLIWRGQGTALSRTRVSRWRNSGRRSPDFDVRLSWPPGTGSGCAKPMKRRSKFFKGLSR